MKTFSWRFIRVWQRNLDVFLKLWHSEAPGFVVEPVFILLTMGMGLGAFIGTVDGQKYIEFIVPGIVASYAMFSAAFECTYSTYVRMEYQKTFDAIISTPLNVEDVIAGEISWGATRSFLTGTAILIVAWAFHLIHSPWAVMVPLVAALAGVLFSSISMVVTSLAPSINSFNYYFTLFITPMFYFSGVFFPLTSFPKIIQDFSWVVPLTPVVSLTRALVNGIFLPEQLLALGLVIVLTAGFFILSMYTMKRRLVV